MTFTQNDHHISFIYKKITFTNRRWFVFFDVDEIVKSAEFHAWCKYEVTGKMFFFTNYN